MKASHGAISRRDDGIVLIDPEKAKGQHELMNACPYGMIWWNEERQVPQKCTFCAHLLDQGWKEPRCVQACPTGALQVKCIEDSEMARIAASEGLECSHPEYKTDPQVYYANLQRFDRCFIGGSIAMGRDSTVDCATGAKVALQQGGQTVAQTTTDEFGDFRFDGLEPGSSGYSIDVQLEGFNNRTLPVPELSTSLSLGTIFLDTSDQHAG
jgi:dissimilatory sulfite reductase (desulfoviridin) alpha/beta subunit